MKCRCHKISEPNDEAFKTYLEHLRNTMTGSALLASFIFTALTLLLVELEDVTGVITQATLLVLLITFLLAILHLSIIQVREAILTGQAVGSKLSLPYTPGFKVGNYLTIILGFLWSASVVLMFFCRGLIYLGGISIVLVGLFYLVYLIAIMIPTLKAFKKITESQN